MNVLLVQQNFKNLYFWQIFYFIAKQKYHFELHLQNNKQLYIWLYIHFSLVIFFNKIL